MSLSAERRMELLAATPLFGDVDQAGLAALAQRAVEVDFGAGQVIARQGADGTGFFVIASGSVEVIRDGRTAAALGAGDFFGELAVLDGRPRSAQIVASAPTSCLALPSWDLEAALREHPSLAMAMLRGLAGRLRALTETDRH